jgi:hypothetical protein
MHREKMTNEHAATMNDHRSLDCRLGDVPHQPRADEEPLKQVRRGQTNGSPGQ